MGLHCPQAGQPACKREGVPGCRSHTRGLLGARRCTSCSLWSTLDVRQPKKREGRGDGPTALEISWPGLTSSICLLGEPFWASRFILLRFRLTLDLVRCGED